MAEQLAERALLTPARGVRLPAWAADGRRPGLTGLWQVSGRSDLPWEQAVRLDLKYVDNWSLLGDAAILARTVVAVLSHRGAY